jgi:hypothetical protein
VWPSQLRDEERRLTLAHRSSRTAMLGEIRRRLGISGPPDAATRRRPRVVARPVVLWRSLGAWRLAVSSLR